MINIFVINTAKSVTHFSFMRLLVVEESNKIDIKKCMIMMTILANSHTQFSICYFEKKIWRRLRKCLSWQNHQCNLWDIGAFLICWMYAASRDLAAAPAAAYKCCINLNAYLGEQRSSLWVCSMKIEGRSVRVFRACIACDGARNTWKKKKRNARDALSPHPRHFDGGHPVS